MTRAPRPVATPRSRVLAALALLAIPLAACGGDAKPTTPPPQDIPPPPPLEVSHAAPQAVAEVAQAPVARPPECEVRCISAEGARAVDEDGLQQVADSLGGVFDSLRGCAQRAGIRTHHSPMVTLRYGATPDQSFVGVDHAGFESAEPCITDTVLGTAPRVNLAGPAVVRCSESCVVHRVKPHGRAR